MRLIDADTLLNQIKYKPIPNILSETWNELYERVIDEIDNAPTECEKYRSFCMAKQRPQGEWIEDSGNIACSHCHTIWLYRRTAFCPNCGAQMNGGEDYD